MLKTLLTNLLNSWRNARATDVNKIDRLELSPFTPLPDNGYLVGGAVRDALLDKPASDIDWLVPNPQQAAEQVAKQVDGSCFVMDESRNVWRVVNKQADGLAITRDYVPLEGSLEDDLSARDFSINAIAVDLTGQIHDPLGGRQDIANKLVRAISLENLYADPLRLLRGVRFCCQLGFTLEPQTKKMMHTVAKSQRSGDTPKPAWERVASELNGILLTPLAAQGFSLLAELELLDLYLPELAAGRGLVQGGFHHLDVLDHSIEALHQLLLGFPDASLSLRWGTLLHDVGKPDCHNRDPETGSQHFYGHDKHGADLTQQILQRLCQPSAVIHDASQLVRYHMLPLPTEDRPIRRFIHRRREILPDLLKVMLADREAARGKQTSGAARKAYRLAVAKVVERLEQAPPPEPLLNGQEVMALLNLQPGPQIGDALRFINEARAVGDIQTKDDAKTALQTYAKQQGW